MVVGKFVKFGIVSCFGILLMVSALKKQKDILNKSACLRIRYLNFELRVLSLYY